MPDHCVNEWLHDLTLSMESCAADTSCETCFTCTSPRSCWTTERKANRHKMKWARAAWTIPGGPKPPTPGLQNPDRFTKHLNFRTLQNYKHKCVHAASNCGAFSPSSPSHCAPSGGCGRTTSASRPTNRRAGEGVHSPCRAPLASWSRPPPPGEPNACN